LDDEKITMGTTTIDQAGAPAPDEVGRAQAASLVDFGCRVLDVVVAFVALVVLMPLMLLIAAVIKLESRGPVVFRQRRVGRGMRLFTVNKFRTMHHGVSHEVHREFVLGLISGAAPRDADGSPRFKLTADARVTRVGRVLRRTSLDELPQLWNVVRGEMSLVGPRPAIPYEVENYPPHWLGRFRVKPGVTGLWQVSGRSQVTLEEMIQLDMEYVRRRSLLFNLWILLRTVPAVLSTRGAS
jgi:lipopolysaccharide/colanic/teichoic acid biosynthesis glycosyltransferase